MNQAQYTLNDKVALVTGGGRGIGSEICRQLAASGAKVVVTDIDTDSAQQTAEQIKVSGGDAYATALNVASEADWERVFEFTQANCGKLNILVNNAGIFKSIGAEETTLDLWRKTMAVNLDGVFLGVRESLRVMAGHGEPCSIINIVSVNGLDAGASETCPAYCVSKAGVKMLSRSVALECGRKGYNIRVNSICPGGIDTPMSRESLTAEMLEFRKKANPIGRGGEVIDIANAAVFLASEASSFITGTELIVDGGFSAGYIFGCYPGGEATV
jgi:NAD(P)-dependent dehydrogenase (short-subunit alcohol dehydrogenase family)